jgi:hypothetical protein
MGYPELGESRRSARLSSPVPAPLRFGKRCFPVQPNGRFARGSNAVHASRRRKLAPAPLGERQTKARRTAHEIILAE